MIKKILIGIGVIIAGILIVAAFQAPGYHVERSATVQASPATIYAQVNDFHHWAQFSPWQQVDPNAAITFDGTPSGVGSKMHWAGNSEMGEGEMTITGSTPNA